MKKETKVTGRSRFFLTRALPALALTLAVGLGVLILMIWARNETDEASHERQARLVSLVISHLKAEVAHSQESATVWDESVIEVRAGNIPWIDNNLGTWMHDYFGFEGIYVLDPADRPIYAFTDNAVADPDVYNEIAGQVGPLADALRAMLLRGDYSQVNEKILTPGVSDMTIVGNRPAIVSVKPIVPDTDSVEQATGDEFLHVAIRYLDGSLIEEIETDFMFDGLQFSWTPSTSSQPLVSSDNTTIGYLTWQPFLPGSAVMARLIPVLAGVLLLALVTIAAFLTLHYNRMKELEESEERIRYLALHDPLTDLPNRMSFKEKVDKALARTPSVPRALLYLDLDRFKQVNDTLGHNAGDAVIREFAKRIRAIVRDEDEIARMGGDEFTVMLAGQGGEREIESICERLVEAARKPFRIDGNLVFIGVSIGAAISPRDGDDRVTLLRKADVALYYSKATGRNRYAFFDREMDDTLGLRRKTEMDLRTALRQENQLSVYYQPIFSAASRQIVGCEALLRWHHPEIGWISPELFIPIAEETGLIEDIGQFVLQKACTAASNWSGLSIAVNVSGIELRDAGYAARVDKILKETGLPAHSLELEVTESVATDENGAAIDNLRALRDLGIKIAIDDFGTGFSSLGRLQSLDIDRVKIDRSFVGGMMERTDDAAIIRAIVDLAHTKGLETTAEGVETMEQNESLVSIGCDQLQGFFFGRPMPLQDINIKLGVSRNGSTPLAAALGNTGGGKKLGVSRNGSTPLAAALGNTGGGKKASRP